MSLLTFSHSNRIRSFANRVPRWPFTLNTDSPQAQGLVAWWPLGEAGRGINYANGNKLDAIPTASVVTAPHLFSGLGKSFPGTVDQNLEISAAEANAALDITQGITVSTWCIRKGAATNAALFDKTDGGTTNTAYLLFMEAQAPIFRVVIGGAQKTATGTTSLVVDVPTLVTGTYDGTTVRVYINGIQDGETTTSGDIDSSDGVAFIGHLGSSAFPWEGSIWDFTIHNYAQPPGLVYHRYAPATRWGLYYELGRVPPLFVPAAAEDILDIAPVFSPTPRWDRKISVY